MVKKLASKNINRTPKVRYILESLLRVNAVALWRRNKNANVFVYVRRSTKRVQNANANPRLVMTRMNIKRGVQGLPVQ